MKTVHMPCCCRQRLRASDNPLTYGSTAVDLISGAGSFGDMSRNAGSNENGKFDDISPKTEIQLNISSCFRNVFHKRKRITVRNNN